MYDPSPTVCRLAGSSSGFICSSAPVPCPALPSLISVGNPQSHTIRCEGGKVPSLYSGRAGL